MQKRHTLVKAAGIVVAILVSTSATAAGNRSIEENNFYGFPVAEIVAPFTTKITAGCSSSSGSIGSTEDALSGLLLEHPSDPPKLVKSKRQTDGE